MAASTPEPTLELFRRLAPHAPLALRPLLANAARIRPVLTRALVAAGPETAALTRTTFAVTTLSGSPSLNVIASTARAGVNIRIMVGDTVAGVIEHVRRAIDDDRVHVEVVEQHEPSPVSPRDDAFALLERTIGEVFADAVPAPYVMMAATDSRYFTAICERVYRFAPFRMTRAQRESIHSYDEHLGVDDFLDGVRWYRTLLESLPR
jgi:carboxypeptidase PM20D1